MSAPEANAMVPAPRYTIARTGSVLPSSSVTRVSSVHIARLIALRIAGRLMTTVAIGPSCCTRMSVMRPPRRGLALSPRVRNITTSAPWLRRALTRRPSAPSAPEFAILIGHGLGSRGQEGCRRQPQLLHERAGRIRRDHGHRRRALEAVRPRGPARRDGRAGGDLELPADSQSLQWLQPDADPADRDRSSLSIGQRRAPRAGFSDAVSGIAPRRLWVSRYRADRAHRTDRFFQLAG